MARPFAFVAFIVTLGVSAVAQGSEFQCKDASTPMDFAICSSPDILNANSSLAQAWKRASDKQDGSTQKAELLRDQRAWIKAVAINCGLPSKGRPADDIISQSGPCVLNQIKDRTAYLDAVADAKPPSHPVGASQHAICSDFPKLQPTLKSAATPFISNPTSKDIKKLKLGNEEDILLYLQSNVSIMNIKHGRKNDILISTVQGTSYCTHAYLYDGGDPKDGTRRILWSAEETEGCGATLTLFDYGGQLYALWDDEVTLTVVSVETKREECSFRRDPDFSKAKIEADCSQEVCAEFIKLAPAISKNAYQFLKGKEEDCPTESCMEGAYRVDMNNDGAELLYVGDRIGGAQRFSATFYQRDSSGEWSEIDPSGYWGNYMETLGSVEGPYGLLGYAFVKVASKVYWVAIAWDGTVFGKKQTIFLIEDRKIRKIGSVRVTNPSISVVPE